MAFAPFSATENLTPKQEFFKFLKQTQCHPEVAKVGSLWEDLELSKEPLHFLSTLCAFRIFSTMCLVGPV